MIVSGRFLHQRSPETFSSIHGDRELLRRITEDMLENGGELAPILHWQMIHKDDREREQFRQYGSDVTVERYEQAFESMYQSSNQFLDAWIGSTGCQKWTDEQLEQILPYLTRVDRMQLFQQMQASPDIDWRYTDLGTVIDVNLLNSYLKTDSPCLLEVGGGYGRLAEAVINIFSGVKYVMLDAVPGSLMFAYLYLRQQLPQVKIGFYYHDDPFDMDQYDLYICPAWHFERINRNMYDAAINLSSFQEMGQKHIDYYLDLFDRTVRENGILYLQNSRDYIFDGTWNYPKTWERLYMYNSPMSWTPIYPIEVFRKQETAAEHSRKNAFIEAGYFYSVDLYNRDHGQMQSELAAYKQDNESLREGLFSLFHNILPEKDATSPYDIYQQISADVFALRDAREKAERKYKALCDQINSLLPKDSPEKDSDPYSALQQISDIICTQKRMKHEAEKEYASLNDRYSALEEAYHAVLGSKSWKLTAPLRSLLRAFKRS